MGKYDIIGALPGKYPGEPNTTPVDFGAAMTGTATSTPDTTPELNVSVYSKK